MVTEEPVGTEEVGRMLGVTSRTITRLAEQGEIPGFRVGKRWKFRPGDIEQYIESQMRKQRGKKGGESDQRE